MATFVSWLNIAKLVFTQWVTQILFHVAIQDVEEF